MVKILAENYSPPLFTEENRKVSSREKDSDKSSHHITWDDRIQIEAMVKVKTEKQVMADVIGVSLSTIYRELGRGRTIQRNSDWTERTTYSADLAQQRADKNKKNKGRPLKLGNDMKFVAYVEKMVIEEHYSPEAILATIEKEHLEFDTKICLTTLYNYIKAGLFLNITMEECPYKKKKPRKQKKKKIQKRKHAGKSIEARPKEILERIEFGHWEMDTIVGPLGESEASLLVLTERKTRKEIIEKLPSHTMKEVVRALDRIERRYTEKKFREIFKTITVDNGSEFADYRGMRRSRRNARDRTEVYYCHPYSSSERGSNENQNRHIRRWYPKGENFDDTTNKEVKDVELWLNNYPRPMFGYRSSEELFQEELKKLAV